MKIKYSVIFWKAFTELTTREKTAKEPDVLGMWEFFIIFNIILHLCLHLEGVFPSRCPIQQVTQNKKLL
jgi:hypothetical protein